MVSPGHARPAPASCTPPRPNEPPRRPSGRHVASRADRAPHTTASRGRACFADDKLTTTQQASLEYFWRPRAQRAPRAAPFAKPRRPSMTVSKLAVAHFYSPRSDRMQCVRSRGGGGCASRLNVAAPNEPLGQHMSAAENPPDKNRGRRRSWRPRRAPSTSSSARCTRSSATRPRRWCT